MIDPTNPIVKLCAEGMAAEAEGRRAHARECFAEAWASSKSDHEACIAAHYLARHQATAEDTLWWNQEALRRADAVADERVRELYPSLHLNVADSLERLGRTAAAHRHYRSAAAGVQSLPDNGYANLIRMAAASGEARTRAAATPNG